MNYLYLKEGYYFKETNIYDALFSSTALNNELTRTCERAENLTTDHIFTITLNKEAIDVPSIQLNTSISGMDVTFNLIITLSELFNILKESDGVNGNLDLKESTFFLYRNKFYSLNKNKDLYKDLKNNSTKELEKFNNNKVITKSKLIPFQAYLNTKGEECYVVGNAFVGNSDVTSKIIVVKNVNNKEQLSKEELYNLMIEGQFYLLDKSDFVEKTHCFFYGENQTKTGLENFLNNYRRLLLNTSLENTIDIELPNSKIKFTDIVSEYKNKYMLSNYSNSNNASDYDRYHALASNFKKKEDIFKSPILSDIEYLEFAKNTAELYALYVYLVDVHLSDKYLWDSKHRYRNDISFRFTKPSNYNYTYNNRTLPLFDKFVSAFK